MTITTAQMMDGQIVAVSKENSNNISFMGVSEGMDPIYRMMGLGNEETLGLLIKAVNNRTRQRNYFRLYSQMIEGEISEDEFYKALEEHEDDYVISESVRPTRDQVVLAMRLSSKIKDVTNSEELADLFSFDSAETDKHLIDIEKYECVQ